MFGNTCQEELIRIDASKFRKKGAKLEVTLSIYLLGFTFVLVKKGKERERERERESREALLRQEREQNVVGNDYVFYATRQE